MLLRYKETVLLNPLCSSGTACQKL